MFVNLLSVSVIYISLLVEDCRCLSICRSVLMCAGDKLQA